MWANSIQIVDFTREINNSYEKIKKNIERL